jgi:UDP-N-acetylglucosamine 2-epimerase (non-hydrolysing)
VRERQYLLVTLHRPALVDGPLLAEAVTRLNEVASQLPVLFPMHPRTRARLDRLTIPVRFRCTGPVGYLEFLSLEADAAAVLTDSGGVQEETTYLGVPCFTLRDNTERPVTVRIGTNTVLGLDPAGIAAILPALAEERTAPPPPPLWDGMAASRLADVVERSMAGLSSARG